MPASNAFDDDPDTLWSTANGNDWGWLEYQFASAVEVGEVALTARNDGLAGTSPAYLAIQWSDDDANWTTAWAVIGETGWTVGETRLYTDPNYS